MSKLIFFFLRLCTTEMSLIYSPTQLLTCLTILGCNIFIQNFEGLLYSFLTSKVALAKYKSFLFLIFWMILIFSLLESSLYAWGLPISQKSSFVWDFSSSLLGKPFQCEGSFSSVQYSCHFFPLNNFDFIIFSVLFEWYSNWFDIGLLIFISLFSISSFPLLMLTFLLLLSRSNNLLNLLAFSCLLLLFWQHTILLTWMHYGLFSFEDIDYNCFEILSCSLNCLFLLNSLSLCLVVSSNAWYPWSSTYAWESTFTTHPCMETVSTHGWSHHCWAHGQVVLLWTPTRQCRYSEHFLWIFQSLAWKEHKYRCWNSEKRVCSFSPSWWRLSLHSLTCKVRLT